MASPTYGPYKQTKSRTPEEREEDKLAKALETKPPVTVDSILAEPSKPAAPEEIDYRTAIREARKKEIDSSFEDRMRQLDFVLQAIIGGIAPRSSTEPNPATPINPSESATVAQQIAGKTGVNREIFERAGGSIVAPGRDPLQLRGPALPGRSGYRNIGEVSFKDERGLTDERVWRSFFGPKPGAGVSAPSTVASGTQLRSRTPQLSGDATFTDFAPGQGPAWAPQASRTVTSQYGYGFASVAPPSSALGKQAIASGGTTVLPPVSALARQPAESNDDRTRRRLATLPSAPPSLFRR